MGRFRLQIATFLLTFYTAILLTVTAGFFVNSGFLVRNAFGFAAMGSILFFASWLALSKVQVVLSLKSVLAGLGVIAVSLILSHFIYDISWDGQTYHSRAILLIADGWNPFKEKLGPGMPNAIFIQHYAKAYSYAASSIYMQFGLFEGAKALNIILLAASYLITLELLELYAPKISRRNQNIIAILFACNPITIFEIFTFYVDGQLSSGCLILFASIFLYKKEWKIASIISMCMVVILINLKFTALVYTMIICAYGLIFLWGHNRNCLARYSAVIALSFVIGIFWVGYNPYVRNLVEETHVFYPLMGKGAVDIMSGTNAPPSFTGKNRLQKIFESNFARSENIHNAAVAPEPKLKLPFTFKLKEWIVFKSHGVIMGGFGPLWSGILVLASGFVLIVIRRYNKVPALNRDFYFLILALVALMLINPEGWYSRYVPFVWFIPVAVVVFLSFQSLPMSKVLTYLLAVNLAGTAVVSLASDFIVTEEIKSELVWLKNHRNLLVNFNSFEANRARMADDSMQFAEGIPDSEHQVYYDSLQIQNSKTMVYFKRSELQYSPGDLFSVLAGYAKKSIHVR